MVWFGCILNTCTERTVLTFREKKDVLKYLLSGDKSELGSTQKAVKEWKKSINSCSNEVFTMCFR